MIDKLDNCVILPDLPNWATPPSLTVRRHSVIKTSLKGDEDRLTGRTNKLRSIRYRVTSANADRQQLIARVRESLKTGRSVCPVWAEPEYIDSNTEESAVVSGGSRVWAEDEYVFFSRHKRPPTNRTELIDSGGSGSGLWLADKWATGGTTLTTDQAIDTSLVTGFDAAPQAVYKTMRQYSGSSSTSIVYVIPNLTPGVPCRVRLHFAEIDDDFSGSPYYRFFSITVTGETTTRTNSFDPYTSAGRVMYKAVKRDYTLCPDASGNITVTLTSVPYLGHHGVCINAIEVYQYGWEIVQLAAGSGAGALAWSGYLHGVYEDVLPLLWGRASVSGWSNVTDDLADLQLTVEEPLGESNPLSTSVCPTELTWNDITNPPTTDDPVWQDGYEVPDGWDVFTGNGPGGWYLWELLSSINPNTVLTDEQKQSNLTWLTDAWDTFIAENPTFEGSDPKWLYYPTLVNPSSAAAKFPWATENILGGTRFGYVLIIEYRITPT